MHRGLTITFAVLAAGVLLAGCGGVKPGDAGNIGPMSSPPSPFQPSTSDSGATGSTGSAPKVSDPLNPAPILADACAALSPAQLSSFGLETTGRSRTIESGPTCAWDYADGSTNTINISPIEANKNGLSDLYDQKAEKAYFEETTIAGYPAVYTDITDDRNRGRCSLQVGVTDQLTVYIFTQLDDGPDTSSPCPVADKIGAAMVQTLKAG
ncbi:MAG: hypothetical protein QOI21_1255 [Actinomycetota bacterium]|jgi:hypothetical protein|nr:hypothetical protein [Actinomycetota bacterium]